jgi:hypothetical protein
MVGLYAKLFTVYESPPALISRRVSAYTSLRLYECPLHHDTAKITAVKSFISTGLWILTLFTAIINYVVL